MGVKECENTSSVAIGEQFSHRVVYNEHITKSNDYATQWHEALGTQRILASLHAKDESVKTVAHHQNMPGNKTVTDRGLVHQNDLWDGIKSVKNLSPR